MEDRQGSQYIVLGRKKSSGRYLSWGGSGTHEGMLVVWWVVSDTYLWVRAGRLNLCSITPLLDIVRMLCAMVS